MAEPAVSREDLVTMIARAHQDAPYAECKAAGAALADQSKLPRLVAENLGAGFGQWTFFPDPSAIIDFAHAYVPPENEAEMMALARAWATDDAASKHTVLALIGKDILVRELSRIDVPPLREMLDEGRPSRALELRKNLGLDVPEPRAAARTARAATRAAAPKAAPAAATPTAGAASATTPNAPARPKPVIDPSTGLMKMPKPERKPRPKPAPAAPPRKFEHPKFGVGVLERTDGEGAEAKLTVRFESGTKTLLARFLTEVMADAAAAPTESG